MSWGRPGRNRGSSCSALLPPVGSHIATGDDQTGFVEILQQVGRHLDAGPGPAHLLVANRYRARRTRRTWAFFDWSSYPKPLLGHARFFGTPAPHLKRRPVGRVLKEAEWRSCVSKGLLSTGTRAGPISRKSACGKGSDHRPGAAEHAVRHGGAHRPPLTHAGGPGDRAGNRRSSGGGAKSAFFLRTRSRSAIPREIPQMM